MLWKKSCTLCSSRIHNAIPIVQACADLGFSFHFVKDGTLVLSQWLPEDISSRLPNGPTHQVGIGALVLRPSNPSQMLVVQEISGPGK